jgi:cytoskeletal protein CcmA (bactofilin family)
MFMKRKKRPPIDATKLSSLIAEDVEITGDLRFDSGIRIDGRVKGDLIGRAAEGQPGALLVLSATGRIEGTVTCGNAVINGTVVGDLNIEHFLELQSNSRVIGSIRYGHLQMDVGATVRGQVFNADAEPAADNVVALALETASHGLADHRKVGA